MSTEQNFARPLLNLARSRPISLVLSSHPDDEVGLITIGVELLHSVSDELASAILTAKRCQVEVGDSFGIFDDIPSSTRSDFIPHLSALRQEMSTLNTLKETIRKISKAFSAVTVAAVSRRRAKGLSNVCVPWPG